MSHWLLKTEPAEWSWENQASNSGVSKWDGVRNAQAQKLMRTMNVDDLCLFYHTGKAKEVVGIVRVLKTLYPDPSDASEKCGMVDVKEVCAFKVPVTLAQLKQEESIKDFMLFRQPRLSVVPVSQDVWEKICELGGVDISDLSEVSTKATRKSAAEEVAAKGSLDKSSKKHKRRKRNAS
ncbi:hypothetical protein O6H91_23G040000 [Diphasiastrum complanatum]|uniref:Uncharacterized protein n=1 Tax=Diphasiastrum complanatum TaxID=34168 RepID=A0ACC2A9Z0_DIPCM|nr:hypothetical protein O6H91_23G040000 [Diphasiastrum complanatum]